MKHLPLDMRYENHCHANIRSYIAQWTFIYGGISQQKKKCSSLKTQVPTPTRNRLPGCALACHKDSPQRSESCSICITFRSEQYLSRSAQDWMPNT